jgi:hypothetical protein
MQDTFMLLVDNMWHVDSLLDNDRERGNSGRWLVAAFNGGHSPSSGFPNYRRASATRF